MTDMHNSPEIPPDIAEKLRGKNINTVRRLWAYIGNDFDSGITNLAKDTGLDVKRLIDFFAAEGLRKVNQRDASFIKRIWLGFKRNLVEVIVVAMLLLLVALGIRATLFLRDTVVVAVRKMEPGQVLRSADLCAVRLSFRHNYFRSPNELTGLILTKEVLSQRPIRFEDVLRLQVVAKKDICPDTEIESDAVTLGWSIYQPDAKTNDNQVIGHKALKAVRTGDVILSEFIE